MSHLWLRVSAAAIFLLAWTQFTGLEPRHESGVLPIDPPTPYIHYFGANPSAGRVLVIHGLDVSKEVMNLISSALADGGFEVYNIDLPGHGDSAVNFQTDTAQQAIHNAKMFLGENVIVLGHSLGAGLLLDLAATDHFSTMVLLSPPPIPIAQINAEHVLIATGEDDIPRIRQFAPIATDIGEPHIEAWSLRWAAHSAPIWNPVYVRGIVGWVGGAAGNTKTAPRIVWLVLMFIAAAAFGAALLPTGRIETADSRVAAILMRYIAACSIALLILKFVNPLRWLRLFATDYLIAFVLLIGLFLLLVAFKSRKEKLSYRGVLTAVAAAAFVIAAPGFLVASHVLHMSIAHGRWWRFVVISAVSLPFFIADEWTVRRIQSRLKSDAVAILIRGLFLAFVLTGVLSLNREDAFLLLIVPLIVLFWIILWFAAGIVHRNTQSPIAAAVFSALVQGWAFAAWFVIT